MTVVRKRPPVLGSGAGRKTLQHSVRGRLTYDYATFHANEDPTLQLTLYAPAAGAER